MSRNHRLRDWMPIADLRCGALSKRGVQCGRIEGHGGRHEAYIGGDGPWWGDARWAPWEWIVYEFNLDGGEADA